MNTSQQFFQIVASHLLTQGKRSTDGTGFCAYRGDNGLKCALGAVIPDTLYMPKMERKRLREVCTYFPEITALIPDYDLAVLMQDIHDTNEPKNWKFELASLGKEKQLDISFLEQFPDAPF